MLKKTITYVDYNGIETTEDFHFNLSKAELIEMELSVNGGLEKMLTKIVEEKDTKKIMETFKSIIMKAYGKKSDDGKRFIKSEELSLEFVQSEAYSELLIELLSGDGQNAAAFINGIVPSLQGANLTVAGK